MTAGRLLVCSRGLFFEPDDLKIPLYKFPYRAMAGTPSVSSDNSLSFAVKSVTRMKKGGVVGAYVTQSLTGVTSQSSPARASTAAASASGEQPSPPTFTISLVHSDVSALTALVNRLWTIAAEAKAGNRSREQDFLQPLIYDRHMVRPNGL